MNSPKSDEFVGVSLSQMEFVRLNAPEFHARAFKIRNALINLALDCSCIKSSVLNCDAENFRYCSKCQPLWDALTK